jgi:hypothetical protein
MGWSLARKLKKDRCVLLLPEQGVICAAESPAGASQVSGNPTIGGDKREQLVRILALIFVLEATVKA